MTREQFDAQFASRDDEFNARPDRDEVNGRVFADVQALDADEPDTIQFVKSAYDRHAD